MGRFDKLSPAKQEDLIFDLVNAFSLVRNPIDTALLLRDLVTEDEVRDLAKRLRIAKLVLAGETTEAIAKELHCSFATVSKVRIWLANAGDGFKKVIKQLPKRKEVHRPKRVLGLKGYPIHEILLYLTTAYMTKREKERLTKVLEEMRVKTATDRDFQEEVNLEFASRKKKK